MATVFTKIIEGEIPGRFVWADDVCVVFASINPISDGHLLVVPRQEVQKFTDADDGLLAHLIQVAKIAGRAQEEAFSGSRAAVIVAGFEVPHLHIHVIPARGEADLTFANARADVPGAELDSTTEKVRAALRRQGHGANVPPDLGSARLG